MGERKSKEYLNKVKEKYGVDELWSWSKYHSYKNLNWFPDISIG